MLSARIFNSKIKSKILTGKENLLGFLLGPSHFSFPVTFFDFILLLKILALNIFPAVAITFFPPFQAKNSSAEQRLKMLTSIIHYINRSQQKYVVVADCNNVCNMTFDSVGEQNIESGAELTII